MVCAVVVPIINIQLHWQVQSAIQKNDVQVTARNTQFYLQKHMNYVL
jgi:hypothetical protein